MQQAATNLRKLISGFIRNIHAEAGNSVKYVSVVVHGETEHLEEDRFVQHLNVLKEEGPSRLSYQDIKVDAPIDNSVTLVTIRKTRKQK